MVYLAHVAGWDPYNPHDLSSGRFLGRICYYADPAQSLTTACEELDDLSVDR